MALHSSQGETEVCFSTSQRENFLSKPGICSVTLSRPCCLLTQLESASHPGDVQVDLVHPWVRAKPSALCSVCSCHAGGSAPELPCSVPTARCAATICVCLGDESDAAVPQGTASSEDGGDEHGYTAPQALSLSFHCSSELLARHWMHGARPSAQQWSLNTTRRDVLERVVPI